MNSCFNIRTLTFIIIILISSLSSAQLKQDSWLMTLNVGYAPLKSSVTKQSIGGYTVNITIEKLRGNTQWAFGGNLAFFKADDELMLSDGGEKVYSSISITAIFLTAKYFITTTEVTTYIGFGLGVNFSNNDLSASGFYDLQGNELAGSSSLTSLALSSTLGLNWFVSKSIFLGLNVIPIWTEKTFFDSNLNWLFNLAVGFQI